MIEQSTALGASESWKEEETIKERLGLIIPQTDELLASDSSIDYKSNKFNSVNNAAQDFLRAGASDSYISGRSIQQKND